jgi:uncharacterized protein YjbJ (UPF0337 family)
MNIYKDFAENSENLTNLNVKGLGNESWWDIVDDEMDRSSGERTQLVAAMMSKYNLSKSAAEKIVDWYWI